jgi:hypothetical protein
MATIAITDEKKKHISNLIKSYKAIDSAFSNLALSRATKRFA